MTGVPDDVIESLRTGTAIADPKLNALASFVRSLSQNNGAADATEVDAFLAAGYTQEQALEALVAIAQKTMSNYMNHFAQTPKDDAFAAQAWSKPAMAG